MTIAKVGPWAEKAWLRMTLALLAASFACAAWFLYQGAVSDYMTFFALPAYAVLAIASMWARILWVTRRTEKLRIIADFTATAIFVISLLDVFDYGSTREELELSGPFILLGLWCVLIDEIMSLARTHLIVTTQQGAK
jgi:uncharacterized membrane protein